MSLFTRHPRARWIVPGAAVVLVAGVAVGANAATTARSSGSPDLPPTTAEQLLVDLQQPTAQSLQGTATVRADLGLPSVPGLTDAAGVTGAGAQGTTGALSLLTGTHTVRVWTDGQDRSKVAVLADGSESDVIRDGSDVWLWSGADRTAAHATLPSSSGTEKQKRSAEGLAGLTTPDAVARAALDAVDPTTKVIADGTTRVAGHDAYELVVDPKTDDTLVDKVALAVDAKTHVPLRVEVYSTKRTAPVVEAGFTSVSYRTPADSTFEFTAPKSATVKQLELPTAGDLPLAELQAGAQKPDVVGQGWDAVAVVTLTTEQQNALKNGEAGSLVNTLPTVSGDWGSGHVLAGTLFTAVLTDDGRVAVGAVPTSVVTSALAQTQ
ncbi:membrane protein [Luteimicrobium album]|uniref:Membrane protein n=1 Tax=Luteimicrobium album TaxID=1054550 RepID=A0ABQ6HY22_9MICO|nr:sigma-E factor regulatory protein RseB domain-containing protein [Luteimicrobium album]GMA23307.1 membrane protein [Luteimicrobium album]